VDRRRYETMLSFPDWTTELASADVNIIDNVHLSIILRLNDTVILNWAKRLLIPRLNAKGTAHATHHSGCLSKKCKITEAIGRPFRSYRGGDPQPDPPLNNLS